MGIESKTIVLGVIGTDPHFIGAKLMEYALTQAGFKVVNLGVMVPPVDFIKAAIETDACAIMISSLSGYGESYAEGFRDKCIEAGLNNILLYMGGHIIMGTDREWKDVQDKFESMGFDRVYPPRTLPDQAIEDLKKDLGIPSE